MAILTYDKIGTTNVTEQHSTKKPYKVIQTSLRRIKTMSSNPDDQKICHFPHMDNILKDWMFTFFHRLVTTSTLDDHVFPTWSDSVNFDNNGTESKVSDKFRKMWSKIYKKAKEYLERKEGGEDVDQEELAKLERAIALYGLDEMSAVLGAHAAKKLGLQIIGDSNLSPQVCLKIILFYCHIIS